MNDTLDQSREIAPLELSTNPLVRALFRDQVENPYGPQVATIPDEELRIEEWSGQDPLCRHKRDGAIFRALTLILFIQIPAGILSFAVSPTLEWEIIGGCVAALLVLKLAVFKTQSVWAVALGATVANVLMGALVGELIHFGWEACSYVVDITAIGGAIAALVLAAAFYLCLAGDGWYILKTQRVKIEVFKEGEKMVIRESPSQLSARENWWLTWGLSIAPLWSPIHMLYLLCRAVDWLTAGFLVEALWTVIFAKGVWRR